MNVRARIVVPVVLMVGGLGWLMVRGLGGGTVYYVTPAQVAAGKVTTGDRVRLGGQVRPGSVVRDGALIRFTLAGVRGAAPVRVDLDGETPADFRAGQGAVVEGVYGTDHVMHADTVLVQHGTRYTPPAGSR